MAEMIVLLLQNSVNQHISNLIFYYSIVLSMYLIFLVIEIPHSNVYYH